MPANVAGRAIACPSGSPSARLSARSATLSPCSFPRFDFFLQAGDGIRGYKVTGVQTCALPIYSVAEPARLAADCPAAVVVDPHDHRDGDPLREGRRRRTGWSAVMKHEKALAYAAFATVCIVWGTTYLAIRIAIETIPPLMLTSMRFVVAGAVMLGIAAWRGEKVPRDFRTVAALALVGFLMVGLGDLAVVWAEQWVPSGMAALFVATAPFWMVVIEAFRRNGERINLRIGIGMLLGFIGVGLLVTPEGAGGAFDSNFILGALAIQLGSIA